MIHKYSIVHPEAKIGANVAIGPFSVVERDVEIGEGTVIMNNVTIMNGARIGKNCRIFPGAVVAGIPQDLKFKGEETVAIVGDNTTLRECVTVNRGTASKNKTVIGHDCLIMAYCHVAHDCEVGNNVIISNSTQLAGEVVVDDFAVIGGGTLVHQFCHIGPHVMIQGGSKINKDIPPFVKAARDPIAYTGINIVGLRRRNFSPEDINTIQEVYRYMYQSQLNVSDAVERIHDEIPQGAVRDQILEFVRASNRGILRGYEWC